MLDKSLPALEGESSPSNDEVFDLFALSLFSFDQFEINNLPLGVVKLSEDLLFHCLLTDNGSLRENWIPSESHLFQQLHKELQ